MSDTVPPITHRRGFLGRLAIGAAALGAGALPRLAAQSRATGAVTAKGAAGKPDDKWLDAQKGKHRQIFDMPQPGGGLPLIHVRNYLNAYRDAYGMSAPDVNAVVSLYFMTVPLAFQDAMWEKYKFGEPTKVMDSGTNAAAVRNVFARARDGAELLPVGAAPVPVPADASIQSLQSRGATFLLCNNAFNFWIGGIAKATGGKPEDIRAELVSQLLPGVVIVPAMVVAFNLAQERGLSYMYLA